MNNEQDIDRLLADYWAGKLAPAARKAVEEWATASEENQAIFREAKKLAQALDLWQEMKQYDVSKALNRVDNRIQRSTRRRREGFYTYWQRIAAVLFLPLLLASAGFYYYQQVRIERQPVVWQTVTVSNGLRSQLTLADGSRVWLNGGSQLTYPSSFCGRERQVTLVGEAYFKVAKNEKQPFYVQAGPMKVAVTGTTFNVSYYPDDRQTTVVLTSGKVSLLGQDRQQWIKLAEMKPGEMAVYNDYRHEISIAQADTEKYTSWINGSLIFRDDLMTEVVKKLNRRYNVDIEIADREIAQYVYTATFRDETVERILYLLKKTSPISYTMLPSKQLDDKSFEQQKIILRKR
jgi:ferric-dicitrate binding protein FerR (iron transport regulator)